MNEVLSDKQNDVSVGLQAFCLRHFQAKPSAVNRLTGGANMEIWAFDCADQALILRRYPNGLASVFEGGSLTLDDEAAVIRLAAESGVTTPEVIDLLDPSDGLGAGFVMQRKDGEALPYKLFRDERYAAILPRLTQQFAAEFVRIHSIDITHAPSAITRHGARESLSITKQMLDEFSAQIPIYAYAMRWLEDNIPAATEPCLLHGDFRMGNVLIDEQGVSAVLDWELAHIGDPAEDLMWLCVPSWRFGRYAKTAGGVGQIDELLHAYQSAGGRHIEPQRAKFWIIYGTLRWGLSTLKMTDMWRQNVDRSVERVLIGSRTSEVELDLLLMLESENNLTSALPEPFEVTPNKSVQAEPAASELIASVTDWMKGDLMPRESGAQLFNTRVAANALSIVDRTIQLGPSFAARSEARLAGLGLTNTELCNALYAGQIDLHTPDVLSHLRLQALERLTIHQPKYAALTEAKKKWGLEENTYAV